MRVLQVINSLSAGGAEVFVTNLSVELARQGHKVAVLIYAGILDDKGRDLEEKLSKNNIDLFNLKIKKNYKKIKIPYLFKQVIDNFKPTVIHSHLDQSDFFTYLTKLFFGFHSIKFIRTLHNNGLISRIPIYFHRKIFKIFDHTISCSNSVKKDFQLQEFSYLINSIPNGIDISNIPLKKPSVNSKTNLLHIGSFTKRLGKLQKAQDNIIHSLIYCHELDFTVTFLGSGDELEEIKDLSKQLNLESKVKFCGLVTDVTSYMNEADAFIMPSRFEGLPIAGIEAVTFGLPIICSDIPAFYRFEPIPELVSEVDDVKALAKSISFFIENKNEIQKSAIKKSDYFRNKFDIKYTAENYLKKYH